MICECKRLTSELKLRYGSGSQGKILGQLAWKQVHLQYDRLQSGNDMIWAIRALRRCLLSRSLEGDFSRRHIYLATANPNVGTEFCQLTIGEK